MKFYSTYSSTHPMVDKRRPVPLPGRSLLSLIDVPFISTRCYCHTVIFLIDQQGCERAWIRQGPLVTTHTIVLPSGRPDGQWTAQNAVRTARPSGQQLLLKARTSSFFLLISEGAVRWSDKNLFTIGRGARKKH